jgi:molecular chaperone GrpE (heat shock protein)
MTEASKVEFAELVRQVCEMRTAVEKLVPHLQAALRRAEQENVDRLQMLEKFARENPSWPLAVKFHRMKEDHRRSGAGSESVSVMCEEIEQILSGFGYRSFGKVDEPFDPAIHHVVNSTQTVSAASARVEKVHARGLTWIDQVVLKAHVSLGMSVYDVMAERDVKNSDV